MRKVTGLIALLRMIYRTHVAPSPQWRSRLSQPWQTCACPQKWVARLCLSPCQSSTACKVPCRRARSHQRNVITGEKIRVHKAPTTDSADKHPGPLHQQSTPTIDRRRGRLHPRHAMMGLSMLRCPSTTADRAWQEASTPSFHLERQAGLTICCVSTMTVRLGCHLRMTALPTTTAERKSSNTVWRTAHLSGADYSAAVARSLKYLCTLFFRELKTGKNHIHNERLLRNLGCREPAPESCSRCKQALGSFFDHHCPKLGQP